MLDDTMNDVISIYVPVDKVGTITELRNIIDKKNEGKTKGKITLSGVLLNLVEEYVKQEKGTDTMPATQA